MVPGFAMIADPLVMNPWMTWNVRGLRAAGHRADRAFVGSGLAVALQRRRFLHPPLI
jgi:hypothetical protein